LDRLVEKGYYPHRAEAIRYAIKLLVLEHGNLRLPVIVPDHVGAEEVQNLFAEFLRERNPLCSFDCPYYHSCNVNATCFQGVLAEFVFWLKAKIQGEIE